MAIDPAATEKYVSARTSKTAIGLLATYHDGRKFLFYLVADYLKPSQMFDEIFKAGERYANYLRNTYLEANAGFKVLGPIISDEQRVRGLYLGLKPFAAVGEKDGRIRSNVQPELEANTLYVHKNYYQSLITELSSFPQSHQKDILDMLSMAIANARKPLSPEDISKVNLNDEWFKNRRVTATGY
jgi:phage terminase large subunit-like protein